jgi:DNA-directed RNA polymerase alpha subunit
VSEVDPARLLLPIEELELSTSASEAALQAGMDTFDDLLRRTESELAELMGQAAADEAILKLSGFGLTVAAD